MTVTDAEELCRTPAGLLRRGDGIYFVRPAYPQRGWLTATSVSANGLWVYARDRKGMARVIEIGSITMIGTAPASLPQRPITTKRKGRRR